MLLIFAFVLFIQPLQFLNFRYYDTRRLSRSKSAQFGTQWTSWRFCNTDRCACRMVSLLAKRVASTWSRIAQRPFPRFGRTPELWSSAVARLVGLRVIFAQLHYNCFSFHLDYSRSMILQICRVNDLECMNHTASLQMASSILDQNNSRGLLPQQVLALVRLSP
jgi:hypothetical protein